MAMATQAEERRRWDQRKRRPGGKCPALPLLLQGWVCSQALTGMTQKTEGALSGASEVKAAALVLLL